MKLLKPSTWGCDPGAINICYIGWAEAFAISYVAAFAPLLCKFAFDLAVLLIKLVYIFFTL